MDVVGRKFCKRKIGKSVSTWTRSFLSRNYLVTYFNPREIGSNFPPMQAPPASDKVSIYQMRVIVNGDFYFFPMQPVSILCSWKRCMASHIFLAFPPWSA